MLTAHTQLAEPGGSRWAAYYRQYGLVQRDITCPNLSTQTVHLENLLSTHVNQNYIDEISPVT